MQVNKFVNFLGVIIAAFLCGPVVSANHQARIYYDSLFAKAQIAVFVKNMPQKGAIEVIKERLVNLDGVRDVSYVSAEQILNEVSQSNRKVNAALVAGENPFTPYFIVQTKSITGSFLRSLTDKILLIEGVEEAVYDGAVVAVIERLGAIISFRTQVFKAVFFIASVLALMKLLWLWLHHLLTFVGILNSVLGGIIAGAIGAGLYYAVSSVAAYQPAAQVPLHSMPSLILSGLLAALLFRN